MRHWILLALIGSVACRPPADNGHVVDERLERLRVQMSRCEILCAPRAVTQFSAGDAYSGSVEMCGCHHE
jgi:hypothetical protein